MSSYNQVVFSGDTDTIPVPFASLERDFVQVYLDGVLLDASAYTWPSDGQVKISAGNPVAGTVGEVFRHTSASPIVAFTSGNLDPGDLNTSAKQALYVAEEARDGFDRLGPQLATEVAARIAGDTAEAAARLDADTALNSRLDGLIDTVSDFTQQAAASAAAAAASDTSARASAQAAQDLVIEATSGFVGFVDGLGYDFGYITSPTTYFDQNWGSITS